MSVHPSNTEHQQWEQQEQLERNRSKLCILYHAAICPYEDRLHCPIEQRCCAAKRLFVHINCCSNNYDCDVPGCKHSRAVWKHYRKCRMNTPEQHAACPLCSVVPAPYNSSSLCNQFRVTPPTVMGALPPGVAPLRRGDSMAATVGSQHDDDTIVLPVVTPPPSSQQQHQDNMAGRPPRLAQSLLPAADGATAPTGTTTTTLASQQVAAKLKGSIIDDGTAASRESYSFHMFEDVYSSSRGTLSKDNKENASNRGAAAASYTRSREATNTVPGCVMDAFGTLWGGRGGNAASGNEHAVVQPPQYGSGRGKPNRYHSLGKQKKNGSGFLSLRRTPSNDVEETVQPMVNRESSSAIPTDEEKDDYKEEEEIQWRQMATAMKPPSNAGRRESRMRRMQRRFLT